MSLLIKTNWNFRTTTVDFDFTNSEKTFGVKLDVLENVVKSTIKPMIEELCSTGLINGFHFIFHNGLDIRLSSYDWKKNIKKINKVLNKYISNRTKLVEWEMEDSGSTYGGDYGVVLCYNNLEFNSILLMYLYTEENKVARKNLIEQWKHYLDAQSGKSILKMVADNLLADYAIMINTFNQLK